MEERKVKALINILSHDYKSMCLNIVKHVCGNVHQKNSDGENLLHTFVEEKYDEEGCLIAIKSLLELGVDPNNEDDNGCNFIATAIDNGYSVSFVIACIKEALKHGLDINHQDHDGDTIIHEAIYGDNFKESYGDLDALYSFVCDNGWKSADVRNKKRETISAAMKNSRKYSDRYKNRFIKRVQAREGR